MRHFNGLLGAAAAIAAAALWAVPVALPSGGGHGGGVRVAGTCTKASSAKLHLSGEDGRIQLEFEVDQSAAGRTWAIVVRQNGYVVRRLTKVTRAPGGSFTARLLAKDTTGADRFAVSASRPGESCKARASL